MKNLIIVGAGDFGREAYFLAQKINERKPVWNIKGFLSDVPGVLEGYGIEAEIIGTIRDWNPSKDDWFVIGIANPQAKEKIYNILKSKGARFATLISPSAIIVPTAQIEEGVVISGFSSVGDNAQIGKCVHIAGSMVGGATIGDFSTTTGYANITDAILEKKVFVGSHAVILNHLHIGEDAYICAGSIVFSNVKPGVKVFGNPAKKFNI